MQDAGCFRSPSAIVRGAWAAVPAAWSGLGFGERRRAHVGTRFSAVLRSRPHVRMTAYRWSVVLAFVITAVNAWWALRDRTSRWWDQAIYLHDTLIYKRALDAHGLNALIDAIRHTDPSKAPLLAIAMLPLAYIFGPTMAAGLALNALLWPVLLLGTGAIAAELFGDRARIPSILMVAPGRIPKENHQ